MTDGRRTMATTNDGNDERLRRRTTAKKSRALILPKILNFRKIASFWKTAKIWFFSKVRPFDERVKWRMTDDGDDGWRRRMATTNDGDDGRRRKNLMHSFCQKSWILGKLPVFEKQQKFDFFQRSVPLTKEWNDGWRRRRRTMATTNDGDDERRRRRTTVKKSRALILPKILNFRKIARFWKTAKIWFFSKVRPFDERVKWRMTDDGDNGRRRRRTTATTDDGEKISCTHFAKNLEF